MGGKSESVRVEVDPDGTIRIPWDQLEENLQYGFKVGNINCYAVKKPGNVLESYVVK